jgi:hypothetical protein
VGVGVCRCRRRFGARRSSRDGRGGAGPAEGELGAGRGGEVRGSAPAAGGVVGGSAGGGGRGSRTALAGGGEER